jgi:hypothetical protein
MVRLMRRAAKNLTALTAIAVLGLAGAGCGSDGSDGSTVETDLGQQQLRTARAFKGFPVLWLGVIYEGLPVRKIAPAHGDEYYLGYGECKKIVLPGGKQICGFFPYVLLESAPPDCVPGKAHPGPSGTLVWPQGRGLAVLTGRTLVRIYGPHELAAARALRPIQSDDPVPLEPPATQPPSCSGR